MIYSWAFWQKNVKLNGAKAFLFEWLWSCLLSPWGHLFSAFEQLLGRLVMNLVRESWTYFWLITHPDTRRTYRIHKGSQTWDLLAPHLFSIAIFIFLSYLCHIFQIFLERMWMWRAELKLHRNRGWVGFIFPQTQIRVWDFPPNNV